MGWVKLDRSILDNWLWSDGEFSRGQAWIDLLLLAAYDDEKVLTGSRLTTVPRGCVRTSVRDLAKRWGWSKKKVCNFLDVLVADNMVSKKGDTQGTLLSLVNYGKYQLCGDTNEDAKGTRGGHAGDTDGKKEENKEKKQKKEEKKESISRSKEVKNISSPTGKEHTNNAHARNTIPPTMQDVTAYVDEKGYTDIDPQRFFDFYESKGWMVGKSKMKDWQAALRGWHSRNGKGGHGLANVRGRGASFFDLLEDDEL